MEGLLTPEEAATMSLPRRPIKRANKILGTIGELHDASGIEVTMEGLLTPFFRDTLVLAARGVREAIERGADIVHIPYSSSEYELKLETGE